MSEAENKTAQMRSLVIFAPEGKSVVDLLRNTNIGGWEWTETNFPAGGHPYGLKRGGDIIAISYESESSDRACSSNVVPYDWNHDTQGANKALKDLSDALTAVGIENIIGASDNDLKSLD